MRHKPDTDPTPAPPPDGDALAVAARDLLAAIRAEPMPPNLIDLARALENALGKRPPP
ncbi:MAG: hypothetical protein ACT4OK_04530 [Gemmobacter sp.]